MTWILVAEDDPFSRRYLEVTLSAAGWEVEAHADGASAWQAFEAGRRGYAVVVTDVRMPALNGLELIRRVRDADPDVAILAVSGLDSDESVVEGLEAGADDYLTKPIGAAVLVAKVKAALRRAEPSTDASAFAIEGLELDVSARTVRRGGRVVALTPTELALLTYMFRNRGRIVAPAQILTAVWGSAYETENEILRVAMLRLRRKLEDDPSNPRLLQTHVGLGYSLGL